MSSLRKDAKDLSYSNDGDLCFDYVNETGLRISDNRNLDLLKQMIHRRLESTIGDWRVSFRYPTANLDSFFGNPIESVLLDNIRQSIVRCLTIDGLLSESDLIIFPFKVSSTEVYIAIQIQNLQYENNLNDPINIQFIYDTRFNKTFVRILNMYDLYKGEKQNG